MRESERLLLRAGAIPIAASRHKVYLLGGRRVTLHHGSRVKSYEVEAVKRAIRKAGRG